MSLFFSNHYLFLNGLHVYSINSDYTSELGSNIFTWFKPFNISLRFECRFIKTDMEAHFEWQPSPHFLKEMHFPSENAVCLRHTKTLQANSTRCFYYKGDLGLSESIAQDIKWWVYNKHLFWNTSNNKALMGLSTTRRTIVKLMCNELHNFIVEMRP